jgi:bifunctional non-homologous end joining protein LigD
VRPKDSSQQNEEANRVAGVHLSHPDRILYPEQGVSKRQLALFYERIADWILPHVVERLISLVRCPRGRQSKCFFQRNFTESLPDQVTGIDIQEKGGEPATYIAIKDLPGLIALVQIGVLEIHPWGSKIDRLERPDRLVFDLDPAPAIAWERVQAAAELVRQRLAALGLTSFLKTSGGKGLHVIVPLVRRSTWEELEEFAESLAKDIARERPDEYVAKASKAARKGKIFIDYLRNHRGATSVAPYSTRARPGAPVSTPLRWDELASLKSSAVYNIENLSDRLSALKEDPWAGFFELQQSITKDMMENVKRNS